MSTITYHPHPAATAMNTITSFEDAHKAMIEIRKFTEAQMWRETLPSTPTRKTFTAEIVRPMRGGSREREPVRLASRGDLHRRP